MAIHWSSRHGEVRSTWWIAVLFAIGSTCFLIGPFPGFIQLVGSAADGLTFFIGSIFFTSAAFLQAFQATGQDRLATLIQLVGTVFFNASTFGAMQASLDNSQVNRLVWAPELVGSVCFLASGLLAFAAIHAIRPSAADSTERRIAAVNLGGCILFAVATLAGYIVPKTGDVLSLAAANWATSLGALCFLVGSLILLPPHASARPRRAAGAPSRSATAPRG